MIQSSGGVLAFIGDAVLSLQVRLYLVELGYTKAKDLQEKSTIFVSAKAQSKFILKLLDDKVLSDEELAVYRRGRNDHSSSIAKNADVISYRQATGMEALWGYLYHENQARLQQLWEIYKTQVGEENGTMGLRKKYSSAVVE